MTTTLALKERYDRAVAHALANRVPDEDRNGPGFEPVTVTGWYGVPTVSGRQAWVRYTWSNGRCYQGVCTYDLTAENDLRDAELAYEPWHHDATWRRP